MLGLGKDFFKQRWKLRLTANDIFHKTNAAGIYSVEKPTSFSIARMRPPT